MLVGTARFELATYGTQNRRATRLRYAPNARRLRTLKGFGKGLFAARPAASAEEPQKSVVWFWRSDCMTPPQQRERGPSFDRHLAWRYGGELISA